MTRLTNRFLSRTPRMPNFRMTKALPIIGANNFTKRGKRGLFMGPPPAQSGKEILITATGMGGLIVATTLANNKDTEKETPIEESEAKTIIKKHCRNEYQTKLLEAAQILGLYDTHNSEGNISYFRGETVSLNTVVEEMNKKLGEVMKLEKHTSITSSLSTANFFSPKGAIWKDSVCKFKTDYCNKEKSNTAPSLLNTFACQIIKDSYCIKKQPIVYTVYIPKEFKFIMIPIDYAPQDADFMPLFYEREYVLPKGTLIIITKSKPPKGADPEKLYYNIRVLSDEEVKKYHESQSVNT